MDKVSEAEVLQAILLEAPKLGCRLLRNNIGKFEDKTGRWVTFGLGGEGGADLIGWTTIDGVAVITAIEVKAPGARTPKDRIIKQAAFVGAINDAGGIGAICDNVEQFRAAVDGYRSNRRAQQ